MPRNFLAFALVFVMEHNDAALSHMTFAHPFLVLIFCNWRRCVSLAMLLHTLLQRNANSLFLFVESFIMLFRCSHFHHRLSFFYNRANNGHLWDKTSRRPFLSAFSSSLLLAWRGKTYNHWSNVQRFHGANTCCTPCCC